jgi:hypothetical protein
MSDIIHSTDYLFAKSSFLTGAGTVLNLRGDYYLYNYSDSGEEADIKALASDWKAIGNDIKDSMKNFQEEFIDE